MYFSTVLCNKTKFCWQKVKLDDFLLSCVIIIWYICCISHNSNKYNKILYFAKDNINAKLWNWITWRHMGLQLVSWHFWNQHFLLYHPAKWHLLVRKWNIFTAVYPTNMQFGYMVEKGTTDAIFIVRQLQEKYLAKNGIRWSWEGIRQSSEGGSVVRF